MPWAPIRCGRASKASTQRASWTNRSAARPEAVEARCAWALNRALAFLAASQAGWPAPISRTSLGSALGPSLVGRITSLASLARSLAWARSAPKVWAVSVALLALA